MKESNQLQERALQLLQERGVTIDDIAELVHFLQKISSKFRDVRMRYNVERVLSKREVQNALITGIELDVLAEKGMLSERYKIS